jgi:hypothetical protein
MERHAVLPSSLFQPALGWSRHVPQLTVGRPGEWLGVFAVYMAVDCPCRLRSQTSARQFKAAGLDRIGAEVAAEHHSTFFPSDRVISHDSSLDGSGEDSLEPRSWVMRPSVACGAGQPST